MRCAQVQNPLQRQELDPAAFRCLSPCATSDGYGDMARQQRHGTR